MAFSGYHKVRKKLLEAGVEIFEYKPNPKNFELLYQRSYPENSKQPVFAIHAKSMVVDKKIAMIGTFNMDPRSIHLNTEVAMLVPDDTTANVLRELILDDMSEQNSWRITNQFNPDDRVSLGKRVKLLWYKLLPLQPIL